MKKALLFSLLLLIANMGVSQSRESADKVSSSLAAGAEFSIYNPDFYCSSTSPFTCGNSFALMKGIGAFADYDVRGRYGAEGEARWLHWDGAGGQVESTYLIGPRYRVYRHRAVGVWVKFLMGAGSITTEDYPAPDTLKGTMFAYAMGASVDYRLDRRWSARVDYELQKWPTFAVLPPNTHPLTPNGFSLGVVYSIFSH